MKTTLKIEGMMCPHCEARVKKALEALDGVESAVVSHETGTAVVTGSYRRLRGVRAPELRHRIIRFPAKSDPATNGLAKRTCHAHGLRGLFHIFFPEEYNGWQLPN